MFEVADAAEPARTPEPPGRSGLPIEPRRLVGALSRGRRLLVGATLFAGAIGAAVAKLGMSADYTAATVLLWEPPPSAQGSDEKELRTLVDSVKLSANVAAVRERLRLEAPLDAVGSSISVVSSSASRLLTIMGTADSPTGAVALSTATTQVFLDHEVSVERDKAQERADRLTSDVEQARASVAKLRAAYDAFREANHVADLPAETLVAIQQAAKLRTDAEAALVAADAEKARTERLRAASAGQTPTTVLSEKEVRPDAQRLADATAELAALSGQLSEDHPKVLALRAEIDALRTQGPELHAARPERTVGRNPQWDAIQQGLTVSEAEHEAASARHAGLRALAKDAEDKLATLSRVGSEAATLLARVSGAEQHLAELEARRTEAQDDVRAPSAHLRVVAPAMEPPLPSSSHRRVVAGLAPALGLLAALAWLLGRELWGLRVHTPGELGFWSHAPVVASSTWPRVPGALADLVADIEEESRCAQGTTLLVAHSEAEQASVDALARALGDGAAASERSFRAFTGATPELRRTARRAARVLVVVGAKKHSAWTLLSPGVRLGRRSGVGMLLLDLAEDALDLPDRADDPHTFWTTPGRTLTPRGAE